MPQYREKIEEFVVPYSTAKHTRAARESFMVGALARFNNNYEKLSPLARWAAEEMGLKPVCYNPFMNNAAQLVEVAHIGVIKEAKRRKMNCLLGTGSSETVFEFVFPEIETLWEKVKGLFRRKR